MMFADVHVRGYYPGYAKRYMREHGISISVKDEDMEILKNTVDFVSFSYYVSVCATADQEKNVRGEGNLLGGVPNPYLKASDWGWQIDPKGLRYILNTLGTATRNHCLLWKMARCHGSAGSGRR